MSKPVSGRDPLGRQALFSAPKAGTAHAALDKESLFSASAGSRRWGTVAIDCSACGARSRVTWVEFAWRHLPFWLWVPWLPYSQLMSCPACERRTWLGVSFFT